MRDTLGGSSDVHQQGARYNDRFPMCIWAGGAHPKVD